MSRTIHAKKRTVARSSGFASSTGTSSSVSRPTASSGSSIIHGNLRQKMPIIIGVIALVLLIGLGFLLAGPLAGKAIQSQTIITGPLMLNEQEQYLVNTSVPGNDVFALDLTFPRTALHVQLWVRVEKLANGMFQYYLTDDSADTEVADPTSTGLLGAGFSSSQGQVFVNDDPYADLEFAVQDGLFSVKNAGFQHPNAAFFDIYNLSDHHFVNDIIYVQKNVRQEVRIKVSSTSAPVVTAKLNGQPLTATTTMGQFDNAQFAEADHVVKKFIFTPSEAKPYILELEATVGQGVSAQVTKKTYLFASDGVVYGVKQVNYPQMLVYMKDRDRIDNLVVNLSFAKTTLAQPFSLPCETSFNVATLPAIIYSYQGRIIGSNDDAPASEIATINGKQGYVLLLQDATSSLNVSVPNCDMSSGRRELPALNLGLNFIGVVGYEGATSTDLVKRLPAGGQLTGILELSQGEASQEVTRMQPGKAYWVSVE